MRNNVLRSLVAGLGLSLSLVAAAPASATCADAQHQALLIVRAAILSGYEIEGGVDCKLMQPGGIALTKVTLLANKKYVLVAGGCNDASDVDVVLLDENENLVSRDLSTSQLANVEVKPSWTGDFYIAARMANSTPDGAHINMLILRAPD